MKSEQESIRELLKQELEKNADRTIEEVKADKSLEDIALPEGLDEGLAAKIQEYENKKAVYEQLSDIDKEAMRRGYENMFQEADDGSEYEEPKKEVSKTRVVRFRKRKKMAFLLVAVVAALTLAMGMTSIGGKPFIPQLFEQMLAGRENVNINSSNSDDDKVLPAEDVGEEEAYQNIKDTFGIDIVQMWGLPKGTKFLESTIDTDTQEAYLVYDYEGRIIEYRILANHRNKSIGYDIEDKLLEEYTLNVEGTQVNIKHYKVIDNNEEAFMGQFSYKDINYVIQGTVDKGQFEEILRSLKFF